jgi:cytochrome P450
MDEPVFQSMSHWMLQQDPPDHTRLRGLVVKAFTARRVEDMRPRIQAIVDDTLDHVESRGHMDLIEDFAFPRPVNVICDMLGIPAEHRGVFLKSSRNGGRLLDPVPMSRAEIDDADAGHMMARAYFQQLFELRRKQPGDDLTTQLVQAEEDGTKLSNDELTANIILLFGAGHETTVNLIGNALLALFRNPGQLALLKVNPALITGAIEEFLRCDSSVQMTGRVALEAIDDLGGKPIPKGESVLCVLGSANRDPAAYPDQPDRLDITRSHVRPMSFGGGIHFCLGAQLARIEAEIAIATLLRRLPGIKPDDLEIRNGVRTSCCAVSSNCLRVGNKPCMLHLRPLRGAAIRESPREPSHRHGRTVAHPLDCYRCRRFGPCRGHPGLQNLCATKTRIPQNEPGRGQGKSWTHSIT